MGGNVVQCSPYTVERMEKITIQGKERKLKPSFKRYMAAGTKKEDLKRKITKINVSNSIKNKNIYNGEGIWNKQQIK